MGLSADDLQMLDEVSRLAPEYPAWMDQLPSDRRAGEERRFEQRRAAASDEGMERAGTR